MKKKNCRVEVSFASVWSAMMSHDLLNICLIGTITLNTLKTDHSKQITLSMYKHSIFMLIFYTIMVPDSHYKLCIYKLGNIWQVWCTHKLLLIPILFGSLKAKCISTLKIEATWSSKMSVSNHHTTQCNNPENHEFTQSRDVGCTE
jgi:hypothetical protein